MIIGINASYLAAEQKTGVENYASELILSLLKFDSKNKYFLFSRKNIPKNILPQNANYELFISPFPRGWHRFRLPLSLMRHKVDVFFDPGYTVPPFISIPTIITVHDLAFKKFPELYSNKQLNTMERSFDRISKKARAIVFTSEFTKKDFLTYYPGNHSLQKVIYQGYPKEKFEQYSKNNGPFLKLDAPYLLFVGRLEAKKNIVNLIRAYSTFRHQHPESNHKLVLCGKPGYGHELIKKEIGANQKFSKDIIELGYVEDKNMPSLYKEAELFIFPSHYEGFGIPILESFAAGTPVACSKSSSLPEVAQNAAFYFDPEDVANMAQILSQALSDQNLRDQHTKRGLELLKSFTWESYCKSFLKLLDGLK